MQIETLNIKLNITPQQLKNLLKVGEKIEAFVVSKKGDFKYIIRLKGKLFEASSNIPINSKKVLVEVKSLSPQIVLKLIDASKTQKITKIPIKISDNLAKELKTLMLFEENSIEAEIVQRKSDTLYLVNIKGKLIELETEKPINSSLIKIILEDEKEIKVIENKAAPVNFIKKTSAVVINDPEKLIDENINKLKEAVSNNDRLKLISSIVKLKNAISEKEIKNLLSEAEKNLIKNKKIDQKIIEEIIQKLKLHSSKNRDDIEKLSNLIKESIKQFGTIQTNEQENLFVMLPFVINSKEEKVFLKKEKLNSKDGKKAFKITLIVSSSSYGTILINGLTIGDSTSISLFFSNKKSFEKFKSMEDKIKGLLGNVNLYIGLTDTKPLINEKRLNIKI